jgi:hypothetical protein
VGGAIGRKGTPFGALFERFGSKTIEKLGIDFFDFIDHVFDYGAGFAGGVGYGAHAPEAVEDDAGNGVDHGSECGDGEDIARDFDGAFFGGAFDFLEALGVGHGADVPDVGEDGAGVVDEEGGELAVVVPGADDGLFVDGAMLLIEEEGGLWAALWDVSLRAIEADVALALLFGIVKRMGVEKRPDELAADVF